MEIKSLLFVTLLMASNFADEVIKTRDFVRYGFKRLESVIKVMTSAKFLECAFNCMETVGCYAVNFRNQSKENCELTPMNSEMVADLRSDLYIMDTNRCFEDNSCKISFEDYSQKDCNLYQSSIHDMVPLNDSTDHEHCKSWCASSTICGGFVVAHGSCYFKNLNCASDLHDIIYPNVISRVYLKVIN